MQNKFYFFGLISLVFTTSACLNSPVLNHANASSQPESQPTAQHASSSDCPIALDQGTVCGQLVWIKEPTSSSDKGAFTLKFWSKQSSQSTGPYEDPKHELSVILWMTSMGHGSAPVTIKKSATGEYKVEDVLFIMGGPWDIKIRLKSGSQVVSEVKVPYRARF